MFYTLILILFYVLCKIIIFFIEDIIASQGRKSMLKHGGDNIGGKYTSRLRDVLCGASRRALLGGFGGMLPQIFFFKWSNLVRFGVYLGQILSLKNFKNYCFLYKNLINYYFFNKNFKSYYFLYQKKIY